MSSFREALQSVVATAISLSSGVRALEGPLNQEVEDAAEQCWLLQSSKIQVGNKLLLQHQEIDVPEPVLDEVAVNSTLKSSLQQWRQAFDSSVASSALELRICEASLPQKLQSLFAREDLVALTLLEHLDAVQTALRDLRQAHSKQGQNVLGRVMSVLELMSQQIISNLAQRGINNDDDWRMLIGICLAHPQCVANLKDLAQPSVEEMPMVVRQITCTEQDEISTRDVSQAQDSQRGRSRQDSESGNLRHEVHAAQATLLSSLDWMAFARQGTSAAHQAVIESLTCLVDEVLGEGNLSDGVNERIAVLSEALKILQRLTVSSSWALRTSIIWILAVSLGTQTRAISNELKDAGLPGSPNTSKFPIVSLVELVWGRNLGQRKFNYVTSLRALDWQTLLLSSKSGVFQLKALLGLCAALRSATTFSKPVQATAWIWELADIITDESFPLHQDDKQRWHVVCMTLAPAANAEVQAYWAWLRIRLALALIASNQRASLEVPEPSPVTSQGRALNAPSKPEPQTRDPQQIDASTVFKKDGIAQQVSSMARGTGITEHNPETKEKTQTSHEASVVDRSEHIDSNAPHVSEEASTHESAQLTAEKDHERVQALPDENEVTETMQSSADQTEPGNLEDSEEQDLLESMQFWTLFQALIDADKWRLCAKLLSLSFETLKDHSKVKKIAKVMSALLTANPAKGYLVLDMIRHSVTKMEEAGLGGDSAPTIAQSLNEWTKVLCLIISFSNIYNKALASLLSDFIQALFYLSSEHAGAVDAVAGDVVMDLGQADTLKLIKTLMVMQTEDPRASQWLPLLACWLFQCLDPRMSSHKESAQLGSAEKDTLSPTLSGEALQQTLVELALQLQEAAFELGFASAALPMWNQIYCLNSRYAELLNDVISKVHIGQHLVKLGQLYEAQSAVLENWCLVTSSETSCQPFPEDNEVMMELKRLHPSKFAPRLPQRTQQTENDILDSSTTSNTDDCDDQLQTAPTSEHQVNSRSSEILRNQENAHDAVQEAQETEQPDKTLEEQQNLDVTAIEDKRTQSSFDEELNQWLSDTAKVSTPGSPCPIPSCLEEAMTLLRLCQTTFSECLDTEDRRLAHIVQTRFLLPKRSHADGPGTTSEVPIPVQADAYKADYERSRSRVMEAIHTYVDSPNLWTAACQLYQLDRFITEVLEGKIRLEVSAVLPLLDSLIEAILDHSSPSTATPFLMRIFHKARMLICQQPADNYLVRSVDRVMTTFAAAHEDQPPGLTKEHGSGSHASLPKWDASQITEAAILVKALLDVDVTFQGEHLTLYGQCIAVVLSRLYSLSDLGDVEELLMLFEWQRYAGGILQNLQVDSGLNGLATSSTQYSFQPQIMEHQDRASETSRIGELLGTCAALLIIDGGQKAAELIAEMILNPYLPDSASSSSSSPFQYAGAILQVWMFAMDLSSALRETSSLLSASFLQDLPKQIVQDALIKEREQLAHSVGRLKRLESVYTGLIANPGLLSEVRYSLNDEFPDGTGGAVSRLWSAEVVADQADRRVLPKVLLTQIQATTSMTEVLRGLFAASLSKALEVHGNGLEGDALVAEFVAVLDLVSKAVRKDTSLIDWVWSLYQSTFAEFLKLAGPQSGGAALTSFRYFLACLPWEEATFHFRTIQAVAALRHSLARHDRVVLELAYKLDWRPIIVNLSDLHSKHPSEQETASAWAVELLAFALQMAVLLPATDLPTWAQQILCVEGAGSNGGSAFAGLPDLLIGLSKTGIANLAEYFQDDTSCFFFQTILACPTISQGDPGERLMGLMGLCSFGASASGNPDLMITVAKLIRSCLCVEVTSFYPDDSQPPGHVGKDMQPSQLPDCWHLSPSQHLRVLKEFLLPLLNALDASKNEPQILTPGTAAPSGGSAVDDLLCGCVLELLSNHAFRRVQAEDIVPFANHISYIVDHAPQPLESQSSVIEHPDAEVLDTAGSGGFGSKFLQRLKLAPKPEELQHEVAKTAAEQMQEDMADALLQECFGFNTFARAVLRAILTTDKVQNVHHTSHIAETLCLWLAQKDADSGLDNSSAVPGATSPQGAARLVTAQSIFDNEIVVNLENEKMLEICAEASHRASPLLQTLASQTIFSRLRSAEKPAWRIAAMEVVQSASQTQCGLQRPTDITALWLVTLTWLGDVRWRSTQMAVPEVLEDMLNSMQEYVELLTQSMSTGSQSSGMGIAGSNFALAAAAKFKNLREQVQSHTVFSHERQQDNVPDPSIPSAAFTTQEQEALGLLPSQEAPSQSKKAGLQFARLGRGFKSLIEKATPQERKTPRSAADSSPKIDNMSGSILSKAKERWTRARNQQSSEGSRGAHDGSAADAKKSAMEDMIALSLAAFAIQAYIKSVLCPSLAQFSPRVPLRQSSRSLYGQSSVGKGLEGMAPLQRLADQVGLHRHNISVASTLSAAGAHDEAAMMELDQLMEARTELDRLEELEQHPLIQASWDRWAPFFDASRQLLSPSTPVQSFQIQIIKLLLPNHRHLLCCFALR